jgi:hypothetical protein
MSFAGKWMELQKEKKKKAHLPPIYTCDMYGDICGSVPKWAIIKVKKLFLI